MNRILHRALYAALHIAEEEIQWNDYAEEQGNKDYHLGDVLTRILKCITEALTDSNNLAMSPELRARIASIESKRLALAGNAQ
jgi:hypothetical protein